MGNSELLEDAPMEIVERMVLKFPRALFEEVIAKLAERKTSPLKRRKKRKLMSKIKRLHRYEGSEPSFSSSSSSPDSAPPSPPFSSLCSLPSLSFSSPEPLPISESSPVDVTPSLPTIQSSKSDQEHRPERESKKKFYELLSSVIAGDPCPSRFETNRVNQLSGNKPKLLSKQQKREIIKLMSCRRHFPAEILSIQGKGTGVKTLRPLSRCQFICEYAGDLITKTEALRRERLYAATSNTRIMSCYMYYFEHRGQEMCLDATSESGTWGIGRLINHSVNGNLDTVKIVVDGVPRLAFVANQDIPAGSELAYDYGDRTSFAAFPWLKN